jgi:hypothetical protein
MRIAIAAVLAASLAACVSGPPEPRYNARGELCTPEQIANPPKADVGGLRGVSMACRTEAQWTFPSGAGNDPSGLGKHRLNYSSMLSYAPLSAESPEAVIRGSIK